ncbi:MAG: methionyl-tRNA formyltransferase [Candidatus Gastranaerophilales bacterium]|nr:methionyl-tRNA formyltransferase [Candidatus Gastranaerophilales bacterium]
MNKKLKIIFVGIPDMALVCLMNLIAKKFNIVGVVPPHKNHATFDFFKTFAKERNLNFMEFNETPNEKEYIEKLKELNADIGVVCSYNKKFSKEFLKTTKMGYINCHPSLLPYYRGAAPYFHIVNNGEKTSGITLHFMDETFDTGDIIYQEKFDLIPCETMGSIFNRTTYMLSDALIEILGQIQDGKEIQKIKQPKEKDFIEAPKVDGNFRARWNTYSSVELERLIRASNPFYNVFTTFRGVNLKIIKADAIELKHNYKPGQIVKADENEFLVAAKKGLLSLKIFQIGSWGTYDTKDFYNTFTPTCDEFLS